MTLSIHILSTLLKEIELLTDSNWHTFNTQLITVLASNDSDDIITGMVTPPADANQLAIYNKKNKLAKTYIWSHTSKEWHYLVKDKANGKLAYLALKTKFEASSFSCHIVLCKAFYGCVHNPNEHVDIFLKSVTKAKAQLELKLMTMQSKMSSSAILMSHSRTSRHCSLLNPLNPHLTSSVPFSALQTHSLIPKPTSNPKSEILHWQQNLGRDILALERRGSKALVRVMLPKEGTATEATSGVIQPMTTTVTIVVTQATLHLNVLQICHWTSNHGSSVSPLLFTFLRRTQLTNFPALHKDLTPTQQHPAVETYLMLLNAPSIHTRIHPHADLIHHL